MSCQVMSCQVLSRHTMISLILPALTLGCINAKPTDDGDGASDSESGTGVTIYDIQSGAVEPESSVSLTDVIVTSPLTQDGAGFFIQDPEGGEYSGVYVYLQGEFSDLYLTQGDKINISGVVTEYYDLTELTVSSDTDIEVTGAGEAVVTTVSDVNDWEPWEGVVISLEGQTVLECVNSYGEAATSSGLTLDDQIYDFQTEKNATYDSITGVVTYGYGEYKLLPRDDSDFAGYGAGESCVTTVTDIQNGTATGGISVEGVVATSDMTPNGGGFFVQDAGGGEWAGVYVYLYEDVTGVDVKTGDVLNIYGEVTEYYDLTELVVSSADNIEVTGSSTPVVTQLDSTPDDWEAYEGVLTQLSEVSVTSGLNDYGEVSLSYGIQMDNLFYDFDVSDGDSFGSLIGLLTYTYEEFKICPRTDDDLMQ